MLNRERAEVLDSRSSALNFRAEGFTLVEVIIAIAILGICLTLIMQLFAGGLRAARTSCDYSRAVIHAKDKLEEILEFPVQEAGTFEDGFKWESEVLPYEQYEGSTYELMQVKVKVTWSDVQQSPRKVELTSLKVVESEEEM